MNNKYFTILMCIVVVFALIGLVGIAICAVDSNQTSPNYALRPAIEVVNWGGSLIKIRFPYQDYKYILDYSNPYEYIETDAGYDLVIHFDRFERGQTNENS